MYIKEGLLHKKETKSEYEADLTAPGHSGPNEKWSGYESEHYLSRYLVFLFLNYDSKSSVPSLCLSVDGSKTNILYAIFSLFRLCLFRLTPYEQKIRPRGVVGAEAE